VYVLRWHDLSVKSVEECKNGSKNRKSDVIRVVLWEETCWDLEKGKGCSRCVTDQNPFLLFPVPRSAHHPCLNKKPKEES